MEKTSEYLIVDLWSFILFPVVFLFGGLILLFFQEYMPATFACGFAFLLLLCQLIWRKKLFAKISITEKGVVVFYKKEIIKAMKWEEIKDGMVNINSANLIILISDKEYDINAKSGKQFIAKNNHGISLNFAIKYVYEEMSKYLKKIPVKLKNFDKLPIETQTILREMMSK